MMKEGLLCRPPEEPEPGWRHLVPHFRTLTSSELKRLSTAHATFTSGYCFETVICEMRRFMPFLLDRALKAGVSLQRRKITQLAVSAFDVREGSSAPLLQS